MILHFITNVSTRCTCSSPPQRTKKRAREWSWNVSKASFLPTEEITWSSCLVYMGCDISVTQLAIQCYAWWKFHGHPHKNEISTHQISLHTYDIHPCKNIISTHNFYCKNNSTPIFFPYVYIKTIPTHNFFLIWMKNRYHHLLCGVIYKENDLRIATVS